jgi:hypothetical protein
MRQQARIILTAMMSMIRTTTPEEKKIIYHKMLHYYIEIIEMFLTVSISTYGRGCDDFGRCPRRVKPPVERWSCFPFCIHWKTLWNNTGYKPPPYPPPNSLPANTETMATSLSSLLVFCAAGRVWRRLGN